MFESTVIANDAAAFYLVLAAKASETSSNPDARFLVILYIYFR